MHCCTEARPPVHFEPPVRRHKLACNMHLRRLAPLFQKPFGLQNAVGPTWLQMNLKRCEEHHA